MAEAPAPEPFTPPKLVEEVVAEYPPGASGAARVFLQLDIDEGGVPGKLVVLGSPQQRNLLSGVDPQQAMKYAEEVFVRLLPVLEETGVTVAVEPEAIWGRSRNWNHESLQPFATRAPIRRVPRGVNSSERVPGASATG